MLRRPFSGLARGWLLLLCVVAIALPPLSAADEVVEIDAPARGPYSPMRQHVIVSVGETVSHVQIEAQYIYVRDHDSKDRRDPVLIDVPVFVREDVRDPARILALASARLRIGREYFHPREVWLLNHEAWEPVPWMPIGTRVALVSFNLPRRAVKTRFRAELSYDQPHLEHNGRWLSAYLPLLPDYEPLNTVLHFEPDDFLVTFNAAPAVHLRRESVNAEVVKESPDSVVVRPRHRETVAVIVDPRPEGEPSPGAVPGPPADGD